MAGPTRAVERTQCGGERGNRTTDTPAKENTHFNWAWAGLNLP